MSEADAPKEYSGPETVRISRIVHADEHGHVILEQDVIEGEVADAPKD